jgi:hypothetical protein
MEKYRVYATKIVHEFWYCDVEADSEKEAITKYNFDNEKLQESEVYDIKVVCAEKFKEDED